MGRTRKPFLIYYSGPTENTHKFVEKLGFPAMRLPANIKSAGGLIFPMDHVLLTPTYERMIVRGPKAGTYSYVPQQVTAFYKNEKHREALRGVIGMGNKNFFTDYARAGREVSYNLNVPALCNVELAGTEEDITKVQEGLTKFWNHTE